MPLKVNSVFLHLYSEIQDRIYCGCSIKAEAKVHSNSVHHQSKSDPHSGTILTKEYHSEFNCDFIPPIVCANKNRHALIGWTEGSEGQNYYILFAPILYHDYEGYNDIKKAFLNQLLFGVSIASSILHIQC